MKQLSSGTAYLLWCLFFLGVAGAQRFYTGNIATGLLYLCTFGFLGIGQLVDLALIPSMVDKRNLQLRGLYGGGVSEASNVTSHVTVNIGDIPQLKQFQATQSKSESSISPMSKLLRVAKENGGQLSVAQAVS